MATALHEDLPLAPHDLWSAWSWEPAVLIGLGAAALLYARGAAALRRRAIRRAPMRRREALMFWAGLALLAAGLVSPLHRLGEALLWAHMAQHELLMVVAAPLLVLGRPFMVSLWGLPAGWRRPAGRWTGRLRPLWSSLGTIPAAWAIHAVAVIGWHVPALYDRSVESELVHSLQHSSFLGTALLYWWSVLPGAARSGRQGAAILSLFTTMIYTGGLGALLTISPGPWYSVYGEAAPLWGLTPLEDQQLAGLIMWIPAGLSYLFATLWLMFRWLRESDRRVVLRERRRVGVVLPLLCLLAGACDTGPALSTVEAARVTGGDPAAGRAAFRRYGCGACHVVDGVPGADGLVGPPLDGLGARVYLAGVVTNTPEHLVRWIASPRELDPRTAMPDVGVTTEDARHIAAFLYTRR